MRNLADEPLLSLEPPQRPRPPIKPDYPTEFSLIAGAAGMSLMVGGMIGVFAGPILGFFIGVFTETPGPYSQRGSNILPSMLHTVIVVTIIVSLILFLLNIPNTERANDVHGTYKDELYKYKEDISKYEARMIKWPEELERRTAHNSAVMAARDKRDEEERLAEERREALHKLALEWEYKSLDAMSRLLSWRGEFLAECVAKYGTRPDAELERLYVEAFPFTPLSRDPELGRLHPYASAHPFVASIKHLLPPEIPRPS